MTAVPRRHGGGHGSQRRHAGQQWITSQRGQTRQHDRSRSTGLQKQDLSHTDAGRFPDRLTCPTIEQSCCCCCYCCCCCCWWRKFFHVGDVVFILILLVTARRWSTSCAETKKTEPACRFRYCCRSSITARRQRQRRPTKTLLLLLAWATSAPLGCPTS